ncbi:MAG: hypothetical protein ACK5WZ_02250 [Pseudobdellovibrionaceae bacterium]|jgi:hypothetical protein
MNRKLPQSVKSYLSQIGQRGGRMSRRTLAPHTARQMVLLREARRAYRKYHARCFWSFDPQYLIRKEDIAWVGSQLMKNGDRRLWILGVNLCR